MKKSILCLGTTIASSDIVHVEHSEKISALDYDILIVKPELDLSTSGSGMYMSKNCADDYSSAAIKENSQYWRKELSGAAQNGKSIFVFMSEYSDFYVQTGSKETSGTGRNQKVTNIVGIYDNYKMLPYLTKVEPSAGQKMVLSKTASEALKVFWSEYEADLSYEVKLPPETKGICIFTKSGNVPVGAILKAKDGGGYIAFLPDLDFSKDIYFRKENGKTHWSSEGQKFGNRLIQNLVKFDKSFRGASGKTPEPEWAHDLVYKTQEELELSEKLQAVAEDIEALKDKKSEIENNIVSQSELRGLLFEQGKPLEASILRALRLMGFAAEGYDDGESEFDAVFESTEGRLIGEAEGKDNSAVNVTKLRQLAMNIQEDLERDEVSEPAKPVLFGNGYRLSEPSTRNIQFTDKCIKAANTNGTALVSTSSLFAVAFYLEQNIDDHFASECRKAIIENSGIVEFPVVPS